MGAFNSWNVIDNFNSTLKPLCEKNVDEYFANKILKQSKINLSQNEQTADEISDLDKKIAKTTRSVNINKFWMMFMRIVGGIIFIVGILLIVIPTTAIKNNNQLPFILGGVAGIILGITLFGLSWLVKKRKDKYEAILQEYRLVRQKKYDESQTQLANLYAQLHDRITFDIYEKTFSNVKFNDYLTDALSQKWLPYLKNNNNISTIFAISGEVDNNPFIVWRTRNTKMYMEVYRGSVTVMVRRTRTVNGKSESYMAPKIIVATTTNPAPKYWTETRLLYLTSVLKDVSFNNIAPFKSDKKAIKYFNKSKKMSTMDNPEFDKLFPCERDDEIEFRAIWTPMAQEEMIKLIKFKNDYLFTKTKQLNVIDSISFNNNDLYYFANRYYGYYDYREIRKDFINFNNKFFDAIYFMLAPILTIPIYQQTRYYDTSSKKGDDGYSCFTIESKINLAYDKNMFIHPESKTENIFKAQRVSLKNNVETDVIISYGFKTRLRTVIVTVVDFEAGAVPVPVVVIDYIPVSKQTNVENKIEGKTNNLRNQKIDFAITSAILASSMPNESKPDKDDLLKNSPKVK